MVRLLTLFLCFVGVSAEAAIPYRVFETTIHDRNRNFATRLVVMGYEGVWRSQELRQDLGIFPRQLEEALNAGIVKFSELEDRRVGEDFDHALLQWSFGHKENAEKNSVYQRVVQGVPQLKTYRIRHAPAIDWRRDLTSSLVITGPHGIYATGDLRGDLETFPLQLEEALNAGLITMADFDTNPERKTTLQFALEGFAWGNRGVLHTHLVYLKVVAQFPKPKTFRVEQRPKINRRRELAHYLYVSGPDGVWVSNELRADLGSFALRLENALNSGIVSQMDLVSTASGMTLDEALDQAGRGGRDYLERHPVYRKIVDHVPCDIALRSGR